jgi:hypothetical protein
MRNPCPLQDAFLKDHRILIRGLTELQSAVDREDRPAAERLAAQLDRVAGPHIEFEEMFFYPMLVAIIGADFVRRLYREHDCGRRALERLRDGDEEDVPWQELRNSLRIAMDHVLSCGSLASHLAALDADCREDLLVKLTDARQRGARWTEIDRTKRVELPIAGSQS